MYSQFCNYILYGSNIENCKDFVGPRPYLLTNARGHFFYRFGLIRFEMKRMGELNFNVEHRLHVHCKLFNLYEQD